MAKDSRPRTIRIVVNPGSGSGRALATAEALGEALRARGWSARLQPVRKIRDLARWSATCRPSFSCLACVGGDSTITAAAIAAVRLGVPFAPVPSGFGNLIPRAFGHSDDVPSVIEMLESGEVVRVDAATLNGELFLAHETYGVLEDIQQATERNGAPSRSWWLRLLSYYSMGVRFLLDDPRRSIRVEVDGRLVARRAALVMVANFQAYDSLLPLTPTATPTDGLLDVFVIPRTTRWGFWKPIFKILLRWRPRGDEAPLFRGRRVVVTPRGGAPQEIRVLPAVLPLLVPRGWRQRLSPASPAVAADHRVA